MIYRRNPGARNELRNTKFTYAETGSLKNRALSMAVMMTGDGWQVCMSNRYTPGKSRDRLAQEGETKQSLCWVPGTVTLFREYVSLNVGQIHRANHVNLLPAC